MAISPRVRFDIFKRDNFTCRYCARTSPAIVLEVDHVVPVCEGGSDDPINLVAACWECNRGKSGVSLDQVLTGENPHDRAIMLLEQERQLHEYNRVLEQINERVHLQVQELAGYWHEATGRELYGRELTSLENALHTQPFQTILKAMDYAIRARRTMSLAYMHGCLKNWRES